MANNQNSDQNPWRILKEFHSHLILKGFRSNPGRISQQFRGHLIFVEFDSHLNCWILRLATRILIEILEDFNFKGLYFNYVSKKRYVWPNKYLFTKLVYLLTNLYANVIKVWPLIYFQKKESSFRDQIKEISWKHKSTFDQFWQLLT